MLLPRWVQCYHHTRSGATFTSGPVLFPWPGATSLPGPVPLPHRVHCYFPTGSSATSTQGPELLQHRVRCYCPTGSSATSTQGPELLPHRVHCYFPTGSSATSTLGPELLQHRVRCYCPTGSSATSPQGPVLLPHRIQCYCPTGSGATSPQGLVPEHWVWCHFPTGGKSLSCCYKWFCNPSLAWGQKAWRVRVCLAHRQKIPQVDGGRGGFLRLPSLPSEIHNITIVKTTHTLGSITLAAAVTSSRSGYLNLKAWHS